MKYYLNELSFNLSLDSFNHPSPVQSQTSDQHVKTVQNLKQFYPLFWGPSLCIIDQDQERDFLGDTNSKGPALSLPSLVQSQTSDQHVKTV